MRFQRAALLLAITTALLFPGDTRESRADDALKAPIVVKPSDLTFAGPPSVPGLTAAWAIGSEKGQGLYLLRVKLKGGGKIPPHTHPDARVTTVLAGSLAVGFGDSVSERALVTVRAGESYLVPAGQPHFIVAQGGDAEYQEVGSGPTLTEIIGR
jgi:quercetin dioxygenase-like cupin family protein